MLFSLTGILVWMKALGTVLSPFIKIAFVWAGWQISLGMMAWSSARFYAHNCAPPGLSGFATSLFAIGSPICISAWFSHAAFIVAYIASFIAAILTVILWVWKKTTSYSMIEKLQKELKELKNGIQTRNRREKLHRH